MPDSYFSNEGNMKDKNLSPRSALTGVIEIMNYNYFLEFDKFHELKLFYDELAQEIYFSRVQKCSYGLRVIEPEIRILSDRIYILSFLYLEDDLPEMSSMGFKLFVETCNMLLAVALKHELALRGFAGIDQCINIQASSGSPIQPSKKDNLVLSDVLKVFPFEEIFPEGMDQKFITPVNLQVFHSNNFLNATRLLSEINSVGIFMPINIKNYPAAEIAIYADLLIETKLEGKKLFVANWFNWADKHPENFPVRDVRENIARLALGSKNNYSSYWKKFSEIS